MTPEAERFLAKANRLLVEARTMLGAALPEAAGRSAYLAGFHAAQALVFESSGRSLKMHAGVRAEFLRLTRNDASLDGALCSFLARSYRLKALADYETGPGAQLPAARAEQAVAEAARFVSQIASSLAEPGPPRG